MPWRLSKFATPLHVAASHSILDNNVQSDGLSWSLRVLYPCLACVVRLSVTQMRNWGCTEDRKLKDPESTGVGCHFLLQGIFPTQGLNPGLYQQQSICLQFGRPALATHSSNLAWKLPWTQEPGAGYCPWGLKESDTTEPLHFHFLPATAPWQISLDTVSEIMLSGFCSHPPGAHICIWNASFNSQIQKRQDGGGVVGGWKSSETLSWDKLESSVQWLSRVRLFAAPWTAAPQASLSFTNSQSSLKFMSIESVMPSNHFILCCPLLLLPSGLNWSPKGNWDSISFL